MTQGPIQVNSEIGRLKTVLLKRPGKELENLVPDHLSGLLFDDIPYLKVAQEEHDKFAQTLRDEGVEVVYLEKLAKQLQIKMCENSSLTTFLQNLKTVLGHEVKLKRFCEVIRSRINR